MHLVFLFLALLLTCNANPHSVSVWHGSGELADALREALCDFLIRQATQLSDEGAFSYQEAREFLNAEDGKEPDPLSRQMMRTIYLRDPNFLAHRYMNRVHFAGGGHFKVYRATLRESPDTAVAIRAREYPYEPKLNSWYDLDMPAALAFVEQLRERRITEFFPKLGALFVAYDKYKGTQEPFLHMEMDYVEGNTMFTHEAKYKSLGGNFEYCFGEWAAAYFLGLEFGDEKARNYGYTYVDYWRVYTLGKSVIALPPGWSPRRLDMEDVYGFDEGIVNKRYCSFKNVGSKDGRGQHQFQIFVERLGQPRDTFQLEHGTKFKYLGIPDSQDYDRIIAQGI